MSKSEGEGLGEVVEELTRQGGPGEELGVEDGPGEVAKALGELVVAAEGGEEVVGATSVGAVAAADDLAGGAGDVGARTWFKSATMVSFMCWAKGAVTCLMML